MELTPTDKIVHEIRMERYRQRQVEGFDAGHDDAHTKGELERAAACYALEASARTLKAKFFGTLSRKLRHFIPLVWPWSPDWWKPKDPRKDLIRAGALIVAAIERLDREQAQ